MHIKDGRPYWLFIKEIKYKLVILAVIALLTGYFDNNIYLLEEFNLAIPAFIGTAIIISLAFKTNKGYARWWEAKEIWEGIATATRSWNRIVINYISSSNQEIAHLLVRRQLIWNIVLKRRLRNQTNDLDQLNLSTGEISFLKGLDNETQGILFLQGKKIKKLYDDNSISILIHVELEEILRDLEGYMGKAERIKNTVFPVLYDLILNFSIYLFCIVLTYFISDGTMIYESSVAFVISAIFMGFLQISSDLQDPFENKPSDTPMDQICFDLNRETNDVVNEIEMMTKSNKQKHYIM